MIDFYGCQIALSRDALIPRLETEILAEHVIKRVPNTKQTLLDLCTGTGCLGLAIKKHRPELHVILSDISPACTAVAKKNAEANKLDVEILLGDLFESIQTPIDYLVCNPPYVTMAEYEDLEPSVKAEPKLALVGGEDGLLYYRRLEEEIPEILTPGGKAFFEIGYRQGEALRQIFSRKIWKNAAVHKDWAGWDRFFFVELS